MSVYQDHLNDEHRSAVDELVAMIREAYVNDKMIWICGNGGSAALASHMAIDLQKTSPIDPENPRIAAISLCDPAVLTAYANDDGYEFVFSKQLEVLGSAGDLLIGISASGASPNIFHAIVSAEKIGMKSYGLVGKAGDKEERPIENLTTMGVRVNSTDYGEVEGVHVCLMHAACEKLKGTA